MLFGKSKKIKELQEEIENLRIALKSQEEKFKKILETKENELLELTKKREQYFVEIKNLREKIALFEKRNSERKNLLKGLHKLLNQNNLFYAQKLIQKAKKKRIF